MARNKEQYNYDLSEYMKRWYIKRKLDAIAYKGGKCQKCGYDKCYGSLAFHHRDPSKKEFGWSKMRCHSWTTILAELDKCDLLCANCHGEEHCDIQLADDALEWLKTNRKPKKEKSLASCGHCGTEFVTRSQYKTKFCSRSCHGKSRISTNYPIDSEFIALVDAIGRIKTGKQFGVSEAAIRKRYAKAKARLEESEAPRWTKM